MFASHLRNEQPKAAILIAGIALRIIVGVLLLGSFAYPQESGLSLGELARRERERKAAAKSEKVIDLLDLKRDCGADWSCFLAALKDGKPARITFPDSIDASYSSFESIGESTGGSDGGSARDSADRSTGDLPADPSAESASDPANHFEGMAIHSDVVLETDKLTEDSAVLSGTTKNTTVLLTDPERARLLLKGYTRDVIDARERQAQDKANSRDGLFVTCLFQKKALQQFLENRKDGEFSDRDWDLAEHCDGPDRPTISSPPAAFPNP